MSASGVRRCWRVAVVVGLLVGWLALAMVARAPLRADPPHVPQKLAAASLVSPPPTLPLVFSHAAHKGSDFPCELCHAKAKRSVSSADVLLPAKKACVGCHDEAAVPKGFGRPGHRNTKPCRKCHRAFNLKGFPAQVVWRAPRFKFNHKLHLAEGSKCLDCHKGVDSSSTASGALHLPKMKDCFGCHTGTRGLGGTRRRKGSRRATARCVTCHERQPGGACERGSRGEARPRAVPAAPATRPHLPQASRRRCARPQARL